MTMGSERGTRRRTAIGRFSALVLVASLAGSLVPIPPVRAAATTRQHTVPAGWSLVSVPLMAASSAPSAVFDEVPSPLRLYDEVGGQTLGVGEPGFRDVVPGRAFWLLVRDPVSVEVSGTPVSEAVPFVQPLAAGWNAVATPWLTPVEWRNTRVSVRRGSETVVLSEAVTRGWIEGDLRQFDGAGYVTVPPNGAGQLAPWQGSLVFASVAADLVFTPPPPDTVPPTVSFTAPPEGAELSELSSISANLDDPNLLQWTLEYSLGSTQPFLPLASGQSPVVNAPLGAIDPTLAENGPVVLRLTATDTAGNTHSVERTILLTGDNKAGLFRLSFLDLEVPLAGIPIAVTRVYDSRRRGLRGDFGFGWTVEVEGRGRYTNNRKPGDGWEFLGGFLGFPCIGGAVPTKPHTTEIRLSDREFYRFALEITSPSVQGGGCNGTARFRPIGGYPGTAQLQILDDDNVFLPNASDQLTTLDTLGETYQPANVRLTLNSGRAYEINLTRGITKVEDANGNAVTIGSGGVVHSSGRSVAFTRDGLGRITQITDPLGHALTYAYDAAGDLVSFTDREQKTSTFSYSAPLPHLLEAVQDPRGIQPLRSEFDASGRVIRYVDAFGKVVELTHDIDARQEIITDRTGGTRILEYDARGMLVRETDASGRVVSRSFDARGNLLTETNGLNQTTTYTYDARDNVTSVRDGLGNTITTTYNTRNQVLTRTDARGKTTTNAYDSVGNLLTTTDPLGKVTTFTYDLAGNPLTITDAGGGVTRYEYDGAGNRTKETDAAGAVTTHTYDAGSNRLTSTLTRTTPSGPVAQVTTFAYDNNGRVVQVTDPDGTITKTVYDAIGQVAETVDKLDRATTFVYDEMGRLTKTTYPDGATETSTYDDEGRTLSSTDRGGRVTRFEYDGAGRLLKTTYADGSFTTSTYDAAGRLLTTTDTRGNVTTHEYDAAGNRTKTTDPLGNVFTVGYDANHNIVSTTDAKDQTTTYTYDDASRRTKVTYPDGTFSTTTYDAIGQPSTQADPAGLITRFAYDPVGRLTSVTDALSQVISFVYDEAGNRVRQTDASGRAATFTYDALGRETRRTLPDGKSESRTYHPTGKLATRTDFAGRLTTYAYDAGDRLTSRTYPDASTVRFTYSPSGRRASVTDARGVTSYTYDARDRVQRTTPPDGRRLDYGYDTDGHRTSLAVTVGAATLATTQAYDRAGRLQTVTDPSGRAYGIDYDANGNRAALRYPTGLRTDYVHDRLDRLTSLVTRTPAAVVQSYAYTLGPAGHRTQVQEADGTVRQYSYDSLYRLTTESVVGSTTYTKTFTYDPVGNRLTEATSGGGLPGTPTAPGVINYAYDTRDRLLTETSSSYTYDDNGNVVTRSGAAAYTWDFENRLVRVARTDGTVVDIAYDADGNRVQTRVTPATGPPTVTNYVVDASGPLAHVVAETDGTGGLQAVYVRAQDELLGVIRGTGARFYHADGVGSIRWLTDETGAVTDRYTYSAFGDRIEHIGSDPQPYAFAGEPYDPNVGMQHHRARWMDPRLGRFASVDPLDPKVGPLYDPPELHRYRYAADDPVNRIDPSGLQSMGEVGVSMNVSATLNTTAQISVRGAQLAVNRGLGKAFEAQVEAMVLKQFPGAAWKAQRALTGPGGKRIYDLMIRIGDRLFIIESKTNIPMGGSAFRRLIGQIRTFASAAEAEAAGAEVIVVSEGAFTEAALARIITTLGGEASPSIVHGVSGLINLLRTLTLGI
jgi:RHS repeat-associated protein